MIRLWAALLCLVAGAAYAQTVDPPPAALTNQAQTAFAPTDQSGASLTLTTNCVWSRKDAEVSVYCRLTYPSTADATASRISLPVATAAQTYAHAPSIAVVPSGSTSQFVAWVNAGAATLQFLKSNNTNATNADLSGLTLDFTVHYTAG